MMGSIEKELRQGSTKGAFRLWMYISKDAFDVVLGAAVNMDLLHQFLQSTRFDDDVLSEAIEAAEALGL